MPHTVMSRVGLEAGFGFGFRKPRFSRKYWLPGQLRLPSIQKSLASASASASLNAVFDGFDLGFGFVICFTAGFGLGFGFPEYCVWLPRFNRRFDKTLIYKRRFDFYLPAGALMASIRSSPHLYPFCAGRKTVQERLLSICIKKRCRVQDLRALLRNCEDVYPSLFANQAQNSWMIPGITASYR